jgi:hypothetical protein
MSDLAEFEGRMGDEQPMTRTNPAGQATQIEQVRAIAEVRAMVMLARENPRDEEACRRKMQRVCNMPALAEVAFFRVPRGYVMGENGRPLQDDKGKKIPNFITGETIDLARELARCWGNIDYSVREMARDDIRGQSEMMAYAWDLEENVRPGTVFIVPHKLGKFRTTSSQQIYENNAGQAGRRLREQIFNALPTWFKAEAVELCHQTLRRGDGKTPMSERIKTAVEEFGKVGVTVEMLQSKFGRSTSEITPEDLAQMRVMLRSIKRGETKVGQEFGFEGEDEVTPPEKPAGSKLDVLEAGSVGAASAETEKPKTTDDPTQAEAATLIKSMQQAPDAMKWRKGGEVAQHMTDLQTRAPEAYQKVEDAVAARLANPQGTLG